MGGGDEIDVVATLGLESKHNLSQSVCPDLVGFLVGWVVANLIVLTEYAMQIAVAKEDCPCPTSTREYWFLAIMGTI